MKPNPDDAPAHNPSQVNGLTGTVKTAALTAGLAVATMFGGPDAAGQSVETYNRAAVNDATPSIEQVTIARDKLNKGTVTDVTLGSSVRSPSLDINNLEGKLTTAAGAGFETGTTAYAFTEHDADGTDLELKVNQSIGDHKATVGYAPTSDEAYAGFRANHFQDTGYGAHVKKEADGDVDIGGNIYKLWDSGVFTGMRKEDDLAIGVLGAPSSDGPALRAASIYGVEEKDGFMQNTLYATTDSEPTYYGENKFNQFAWSTGSVIGGNDAHSMDNAPTRYIFSPKMFLGDGPSASVTHTQIAGTHSLDAEAYTSLESIGAEDVLVGGHAETTLDKPGLQRLGVDLGYNGDNINTAVSVGEGPSGDLVGEVTFHYKP